jgi:hypothetical protein
MSRYDNWLQGRYYSQRDMPGWVEDALGTRVWIEEEDAHGIVDSYEEWEDADEDGRYGGVDLVLRFPNGRTQMLTQAEYEDAQAAGRVTS